MRRSRVRVPVSAPEIPTFIRTEIIRKGLVISMLCGNSSVGRALASQAEGRGFESRLPLPYEEQVFIMGRSRLDDYLERPSTGGEQ